MAALDARLALGLSAAVLPVSDAALLAVFLATFFAAALGFFAGAVAASSAGTAFLARAGFAAGAESAAVLPLSVAVFGFGGALPDAFAGDSEEVFAVPSAFLGALARGFRAAFGLSAAGADVFVDDVSLMGDGLAGAAAACPLCTAGD